MSRVVFQSLGRTCKLNADQMADVIELFSRGVSIGEIAGKYHVTVAHINTYLHKHRYGIVPKEKQENNNAEKQSITSYGGR